VGDLWGGEKKERGVLIFLLREGIARVEGKKSREHWVIYFQVRGEEEKNTPPSFYQLCGGRKPKPTICTQREKSLVASSVYVEKG